MNYGSFPDDEGASFQGADGMSADSIAIGYFSGTANDSLTGWNSLVVDDNFAPDTDGFNNVVAPGVEVTPANGLEAWLLITDGANSGLVRANDWIYFFGR